MKDYSRDIKTLVGEANRLRAWVGKDDAKLPELADRLVDLTSTRMLAGQLQEAVPQAQEALNLAAKELASHGPLGPYTPLPSAVRMARVSVCAAALQSLGGNQPAADALLGTVETMAANLDHLPLLSSLGGEVAAWALISQGHGADPASANAAIDAAPHCDDFQEFFRLQTLSAARWRAGQADQSLAAGWAAVAFFDEAGLPLLEDPGVSAHRLLPWARVLPALFGDLADRQAATGDYTAAIASRRKLVDYLAVLAEPLGDRWADTVSAARRALADDLRQAGRTVEADEVSQLPGVRTAAARTRLGIPPAIGWAPTASVFGLGASNAPAAELTQAAVAMAEEHDRLVAAEAAQRAQAEAARARREAEEQQAAELARQLQEQADQARLLAEQERSAAAAAEAERAAIEQRQRQRAERIAAHEQALAEQEAEFRRQASDTTDPVVAARASQAAARTRGDKAEVFAASQALVAALRDRASTDPDARRDLVLALQELATAQRQAGDWWGSRKPAKEAKELTKRLAEKRN